MATILTVDDDREIINIYREILLMKKHEIVAEAMDGQEAVNLFRGLKKCPDIIIMDYRMPGKNGLEAMEEIRSINPFQGIIFVTADHESARKAIDMGANSFVLKPFRLDSLFNSIELTIANINKQKNEMRETLLKIMTGMSPDNFAETANKIEIEIINNNIGIQKYDSSPEKVAGWAIKIFGILGMEFTCENVESTFIFRNTKCHWMKSPGPNPNFCFTTKTIITRLAKRTGREFSLETKHVIMDGASECVFELKFH